MAHFITFTDDNDAVLYLNMDLAVEINEERRQVTFSNGECYAFDDDLNDSEWRQVLNFANTHRV